MRSTGRPIRSPRTIIRTDSRFSRFSAGEAKRSDKMEAILWGSRSGKEQISVNGL